MRDIRERVKTPCIVTGPLFGGSNVANKREELKHARSDDNVSLGVGPGLPWTSALSSR